MEGERSGLPIGEAARRLGVNVEAVRKRIKRGRLPAYKEGDRWYVVLPEPSASASGDPGDPRELIAALRAEVAFLRSELTARTAELQRKDDLIADLARRVTELSAQHVE